MNERVAERTRSDRLADKVAFLRNPRAYPNNPVRVDAIETNMAWVFLAGDQAYKLKKPVRYPFLDFSTLELRERDCHEELRLNRRLAPDVYRDVVALLERPDGSLALAGDCAVCGTDVKHGANEPIERGEATVADWLVRMRRLPADRMLDRAIASGSVSVEDVDRLGRALAAFYSRLPPAAIAPRDFVARFEREQGASREILMQMKNRVDGNAVENTLARADAAMLALADALARRVSGGHVVEGHGDLRPEHVALVDPVAIIDCLEFNLELRLVDPVEELVFLGLECELAGAGWIGPRILACCPEVICEASAELRAFYKAHRALVRARLALAHLLQPAVREPGKWAPLARRYLDAASAALEGAGF